MEENPLFFIDSQPFAKTELIFIEEYFSIGLKGSEILVKFQRGLESIYRVSRQLKAGKTAIETHQTYKKKVWT